MPNSDDLGIIKGKLEDKKTGIMERDLKKLPKTQKQNRQCYSTKLRGAPNQSHPITNDITTLITAKEMAFPRSGKTQRSWSLESMRQALQAVDGGMSIRSSAELYGIPRNTLTSYVASELRLEDEMKFMENFDPEKSKREQRKLNRKFTSLSVRKTVYDDKGIHVKTGLDLCDCLNDKCKGCFFACPKCRSLKCGHECRQNRRWMYESHTIQGMDEMIQNQYLDH